MSIDIGVIRSVCSRHNGLELVTERSFQDTQGALVTSVSISPELTGSGISHLRAVEKEGGCGGGSAWSLPSVLSLSSHSRVPQL